MTGCGGGGRSGYSPGVLVNVPSLNQSQGKNGGDHVVFSPPGFSYNVPGGGGGAGIAGTPGQADVNSTVGGDGVASSITGSSTYYGGGGGGGAYGYGPVPGGLGGGGPSTNSQAPPSPANTGGGGGMGLTGSGFGFGGLGGSGVVILRYPDSYPAAASTTGSPSITVSGGKRIYKFNGSGSIVF